jgi:hypothetical protein
LTFFILARNQCTSTDTSSRELVFLFDNLRNVGCILCYRLNLELLALISSRLDFTQPALESEIDFLA